MRGSEFWQWQTQHAHVSVIQVMQAADLSWLCISDEWRNCCDHIDNYDGQPVIVLCGATNSGKSTFGRYIVNRLLQSYETIAYLDCDIGQPELTPAGLVSLHLLSEPLFGPSFTHLRDPTRY
jgi:polynucleotide 5'-kinase involved in rRNA processing